MGPPGGSKPPGEPPVNYGFQEERPPVRGQRRTEDITDFPNLAHIPQPTMVPPPQQDVRRRPPPHLPQDMDSTDGHRVNVNVQVEERSRPRPSTVSTPHSQEEIAESTPNIFTSFVVSRMESDGYNVPSGFGDRRMGDNERQIAKVLQKIGDDMSNNSQLNQLIGSIRVTPDTAYKTFVSVAAQIFQDGNINWGRIVTLFFFAYKLAVQVMNQLPLVDIVIGWVTKFVAERLSKWIFERGGWGAVREYFGATSSQLMFVFAAGVLLSSLFWWWKK